MDDRWFKKQMRRAGVTSEDIGRKLGRDRTIVSRILVGRQKMTLEQAQVFAEAMETPLNDVLDKAGLLRMPPPAVATGFSDGDAAPFALRPADPGRAIAQALGADRPGIDIWRVKCAAMALAGYLPDDFILVDTHAAERCGPGDVVIAQVYTRTGATTVLRRYEPPVLVAASADPADMRVHVVDGNTVLIRGRVIASWRAGASGPRA